MTTEHRTGTGRLAVALVAIAGIALSLLVTSLFQAAAAQSETARRREAISAIGGALQADLLRLFNQVGGFTAWIEEFGYDDPLAFAAYYDRVTAYLESVPWRAVSVAQIIDRAELDARIAELEDRRILYDAARYPRLEVFPLAGTPLAAPVLMVEPRTSRSGVFGFDLASDAQRLALIERTLAGDVPILTPPLTLSQDRFGALPEAPLSTVVWVPLRRRVETGTDSLGLLTLSVTPEHLVAAAVARASAHAFEWDIRIETDMASPEPLSGSERRIRVEHLEGDLLHAYVAGQRWEIQLRGGPPAASRQGSALVLVLSLLVTLLATALAQRVAAERSRLADALEARQIELERTRDAIADAHRVDALGRLTGGVAHDFNNLLGVIAGNLDLLRDSLEGTAREDETHFIDEALRATDRSARLTQKLLTLSRQASLSMEALDVEAVVREMAAVIDRTLPETIKSSLRLSEQTPWVRTDRVQLDSAILNLAINARDAMPEGGANHPLHRSPPRRHPARPACADLGHRYRYGDGTRDRTPRPLPLLHDHRRRPGYGTRPVHRRRLRGPVRRRYRDRQRRRARHERAPALPGTGRLRARAGNRRPGMDAGRAERRGRGRHRGQRGPARRHRRAIGRARLRG